MVNSIILDDRSCERIHETSIRILGEVGYCVQDKYLVQLLHKSGSRIEGDRVYIPERMMLDALDSVPKSFEVCDRLGRNFILGDGSQHVTSSSCDSLYFRCRDDTIRPALLEDLVKTVYLCDSIPEMEIIRAYAVPDDYHGLEREIQVIRAVLSNSMKHFWMSATSIEIARCWFEIIDILDGICKTEYPAFSVMICPHSPLVLNKVVSYIINETAQRGLPIVCSPMPLAGATSPMTLAGTLALANAETLFSLFCQQVIKTGAPFIYGPYATVMNMNNGSFTSIGPERILLGLGGTQLAQWYKLPSYFSAGHSESNQLDSQAGFEHCFGLLTALNSTASIIGGVGSLSKAMVLSPEDMLIGIDYLRAIRHFQRGIAAEEETIAYDIIYDIGPGGNFLTTEHTLLHLGNNERWKSRLFDYADINTSSSSILAKARSVVDEIITNRQSNVPVEQLDAIDSFVDNKLSGL
jgi:trimethylamine--corrinoid protein Co-methyltransferase